MVGDASGGGGGDSSDDEDGGGGDAAVAAVTGHRLVIGELLARNRRSRLHAGRLHVASGPGSDCRPPAKPRLATALRRRPPALPGCRLPAATAPSAGGASGRTEGQLLLRLLGIVAKEQSAVSVRRGHR